MRPLLAAVRSWTTATADLLLATIGLGILLYPGAVTADAVLGEPVAAPAVRLAVAVVAVGGAYPFVAGDWSLGRLGDAVLVFVAGSLGLGVLGMLLVVGLGLDIPGSDRRPQLLVLVGGYLLAYLLVHRGWWPGSASR